MTPAGPGDSVPFGDVQVFQPYPGCETLVFARAAARSRAFAATATADGDPAVIVGAASGGRAADVVPRARGELVERAGNILAGRAEERACRVVGSYEALRRAGVPALDPYAWTEVATAAGFRELPMLWTEGRSLVTGDEVLVPACTVYIRHRPPPGCESMLSAGSAGASAHTSQAAAVRHALLEILERDLIWRSWYGAGAGAEAVAAPLEPAPPTALGRTLEELGVRLTSLVVPGPAGTACVVACVHAPDGTQQAFGARCVVVDPDGDLGPAVERACYEALMVRWSMRTPEAERAWARMLARDDPVLLADALEHALWAFHAQDSLRYWLDCRNGAVWPVSAERPGADRAEDGLARALSEHTGHDVVAVDTNAPQLGADGLFVVRVVAPGARRLPGTESALRSRPPSAEPRHQPPHPFG